MIDPAIAASSSTTEQPNSSASNVMNPGARAELQALCWTPDGDGEGGGGERGGGDIDDVRLLRISHLGDRLEVIRRVLIGSPIEPCKLIASPPTRSRVHPSEWRGSYDGIKFVPTDINTLLAWWAW